jgi:hypothetical protein
MSPRILVMAVLSLGILAPGTFAQTPSDAPPGINARQHRQAARIRRGVENQQLTRPELRRLRAEEAAVRAEERRARRSGDGLKRREVRRLERELNRTSRQIFRAKHN